MPRHAVFLSYSRADLSAAVKLARALETAGVPVWMDTSRLQAGENYERSIQHEVKDACSFFISLISENDTQAVQFSMLLLLASIFFSGFFLDLRLMWEPMKAFSYILPATYGMNIMKDVMLRGLPLPWTWERVKS